MGMRLPNASWHLQHLYDPQGKVEKSLMPPYRHLFEKRRAGKTPSPNALVLSGKAAPEAGFEIVPTREANALVNYLLSLRNDTALFSTPMKVTMASPQSATNAAAGGTNAPGTSTTNAPAPK